ncbi:MAG TPA: DUF192 domain-containing protein [Labilithrix sp.]|nr:DUF192 domain-containing protein [Labilithrix sp.]
MGAVVALVGCSRTPPEPAPAASVQTETVAHKAAGTASVAASTSAGRCIAQVPAKAPTIAPPADSARCPPDPEPNLKMALDEVTFPDAPNAPHIEVELAKTPHDVERGLMYRRAMADDRGMLFRLDGRRDHTFWMHNTCIALDMMFIDDDGVIVGIVEAAEPLTESTRSVGCPSVFVLEVNAGWTRKRGVAPGQKITIPFSAR